MIMIAENAISKSSSLTDTKVPGTLIKGNFGYNGTAINTAAVVYLIIPSSDLVSFDIYLGNLLALQ